MWTIFHIPQVVIWEMVIGFQSPLQVKRLRKWSLENLMWLIRSLCLSDSWREICVLMWNFIISFHLSTKTTCYRKGTRFLDSGYCSVSIVYFDIFRYHFHNDSLSCWLIWLGTIDWLLTSPCLAFSIKFLYICEKQWMSKEI